MVLEINREKMSNLVQWKDLTSGENRALLQHI